MNTTDARTATLTVNIYNVPDTRHRFLHLLHTTLLPSMERAGLLGALAGWFQGLNSQLLHCTASPALTCPSPTHSRPGSHHPVTSGTCPARSPEAPQSWARGENLRRVWGPRRRHFPSCPLVYGELCCSFSLPATSPGSTHCLGPRRAGCSLTCACSQPHPRAWWTGQ